MVGYLSVVHHFVCLFMLYAYLCERRGGGGLAVAFAPAFAAE